jgi:cyclophilin family peptidyl-prolyl cis-trans isomerase
MNEQPSSPPPPRLGPRRWMFTAGVGVVVGFVIWFAWSRHSGPVADDHADAPVVHQAEQLVVQPKPKPAAPGSFLEEFAASNAGESQNAEVALSDAELEKSFRDIQAIHERIAKVMEEAARLPEADRKKGMERALQRREQLLSELNQALAGFEQQLGRARKARPEAAVPAWLSAETLILIGGEPEEVEPHLQRALAAGLKTPRVYASLSRVHAEANRFAEALDTAEQALALGGSERYVWDTYIRACFFTERYEQVAARLERGFPEPKPTWVQEVHAEALARQKLWQAEQQRRAAEKKADDLPRVRLTVEHRRFARGPRGEALTAVESAGKGAIVLELFEDQAPAAVANFLTLVEQKRYDGTRFFLAEPAALVQGGDVQARDAKADGSGGPGYVIPDEFARRDARPHYRGSISMCNNGPHTTGSQFFLTVVPMPEMDGEYTVFGRVIEGQDVVDRITRGRTNPDLGRHGRIIPGDLLVRAEVMRKRNHDYRLVKEEPPKQ